MDQFALTLGVLAGCVQLVGYWQYNRLMSQGGHKPNAASWFMWGIGGGAELIVYSALVQEPSKEFLPQVCAVVVVITFIRVWKKEGFGKLDWRDWLVVGFDVAVVAFWFVTHNPYASNALLGLDMIASFLPILRSVWAAPQSENPGPWRTWTVAYALLTLVVILQWENAWELIYPVLYLVLHGSVWLISKARKNLTAAV